MQEVIATETDYFLSEEEDLVEQDKKDHKKALEAMGNSSLSDLQESIHLFTSLSQRANLEAAAEVKRKAQEFEQEMASFLTKKQNDETDEEDYIDERERDLAVSRAEDQSKLERYIYKKKKYYVNV